MAYEQRTLRRQKALYDNANAANPLRYQLVVNGAKVTPTSATVTIYAPGGTTALVSAAAMTLSGSILTYSVDTTTEASWPIGEGYRAELAVLYNAQTLKRLLVFDVVRWLLDVAVGVDQLLALDDGLQGLEHAGDEDFSELIEACRDELQMRIEARVIRDEKLVENMILDSSRVAPAFRRYVLAEIFDNKGQPEKATRHRKVFDELWPALLASIKYDQSQSGDEDAAVGGVTHIRLVT